MTRCPEAEQSSRKLQRPDWSDLAKRQLVQSLAEVISMPLRHFVLTDTNGSEKRQVLGTNPHVIVGDEIELVRSRLLL